MGEGDLSSTGRVCVRDAMALAFLSSLSRGEVCVGGGALRYAMLICAKHYIQYIATDSRAGLSPIPQRSGGLETRVVVREVKYATLS